MKILLCILLVICIPHVASAQVIYESSTGTSSIFLRDAGSAGINFADASVEMGYVRAVSTSPWRLGFAAKVESPDGFAELFEDSDFSDPEFSGSISAGYSWDPPQGNLLYAFIGGKLDYTYSTLPLAKENGEGITAIQEERFDGATANIFYNTFLERFLFPEETLLGVAIRYGKRNNFAGLKKVEICEEVGTNPSEEAPASRVQSCDEARLGDDYETNYKFSADLDIIWYQGWAKNRIAFGVLGRYNPSDEEDNFVPGLGIFLTTDGAPMKFLGGLTAEHVDNDWRIGLQIGFPFS